MLCRAAFALLLIALSTTTSRGADGKSEFSSPTIDLGMVVSDVAASVKFYTAAVGFKEVDGFKVDAPYTAQVGLTDGSEELDIHVLMLGEGPGATKLKLMQFKKVPQKGDTATINSQLGFRYLTLYVNDTSAALERLKKAGVKTLANSPQPLPKGLPQDIYLTVVRDPDGNIVELVGPKK